MSPSSPTSGGLLAASLAITFAASSGCAGAGTYVWFNDLPSDPSGRSGSEYVIATGDMVNISVYGHDDMSVREPVRSDGKIALPLIGEVDVRGKHPSTLRAELESRLKDFIVSPRVLVNIDDTRPVTVSLLGEVARPGAYTVEPGSCLGQVLALAGGLTEFASRDSIFVVRREPAEQRIRFTYQDVSRNVGHAAEFAVHPGDLVVVE